MAVVNANEPIVELQGNTACCNQIKADMENGLYSYPSGSTYWDYQALMVYTWDAEDRKWY